MEKDPRIEAEIEQTLRLLDTMERASPRPFFAARTEARLRQRAALPPALHWVFRPAWLAASLVLVLALNVSAAVYVHEQMNRQEQESTRLSAEWGFDTNALDW